MTREKQDLKGGVRNSRRNLEIREAFHNEYCQYCLKKTSCQNDTPQRHVLLQSHSNQDKMRLVE